MRRRGRAWRWGKWMGAAITAFLLVAGVLSTRWWVNWQSIWNNGRSVSFALKGGAVGVIRYSLRVDAVTEQAYTTALQSGWRLWDAPSTVPPVPVWWPSVSKHATIGSSISMPLWMPLLLIAVPTAFLWWHDRRIVPPGHCRKCGYDLRGGTGGRCPECGTVTSIEPTA